MRFLLPISMLLESFPWLKLFLSTEKLCTSLMNESTPLKYLALLFKKALDSFDFDFTLNLIGKKIFNAIPSLLIYTYSIHIV